MIDLKLGKIRIPKYIWVADYFCLFAACAGVVLWVCVNWPHWDFRFFVVLLIPVAGLVAMLKELSEDIKASRFVISEEGLRETNKREDILLKWEDIARYERQLGKRGMSSFTLYFKNGRNIRIWAYTIGFQGIHDYCLGKIEQIGSFEDGRKVPHVFFSIPLPFLKKGGVTVTNSRKGQ